MNKLYKILHKIRCKVIISTLLLLFFTNFASAQTTADLEERYNDASYYYKEGKIDSVTYILESILQSPAFPKLYQGIRADIYKLLSMSYITLDRLNDAEVPLRKMLALRPFYRAAEDDLMRFKTALDTLKATPLFSIGMGAGANVTFPKRLGEVFSVISSLSDPNVGDEAYSIGFNFYFGFYMRYQILKNVALTFTPSLSNYSFNFREDYAIRRVGQGDTISTNFYYAYRQDIRYIEMPLSITYSFNSKRKLQPFVSVGYFQGFLLGANKESTASYLTISQRFPNNENFISANTGYMFGFGFHYELNKFAINIDARYKYGLINLTNISNRFVNQEAALGFYDIPNNIKINNIELGISLLYHLNFKVFKH